jgi:hypothetical protein
MEWVKGRSLSGLFSAPLVRTLSLRTCVRNFGTQRRRAAEEKKKGMARMRGPELLILMIERRQHQAREEFGVFAVEQA